jgi:hypothetical protein
VKSAGAIRHKINQIRYRYLKKRLEDELCQLPGKCAYNAVIPAPTVPAGMKVNGIEVRTPININGSSAVGLGICLYGAGDVATWKPSFCDESIDFGDRAKKCSLFCPRKTKDEVKAAFSQEIEVMTLAEIAYNYPDLAALIWVLDETDVLKDAIDQVEPVVEPPPVAAPPPPVPPVVSEPDPDPDTVVPMPNVQLPVLVDQPRPWWAKFLGSA